MPAAPLTLHFLPPVHDALLQHTESTQDSPALQSVGALHADPGSPLGMQSLVVGSHL